MCVSVRFVRKQCSIVVAEQVGDPVDQIEQTEHERKSYARDNVNTFGSSGELG